MINSLQILRVIAAFAVVIEHYEPFGLKFGSFGVDIFFIISGFIITYVANSNTKDFFKKRIARIVPLYTFSTILVVGLTFINPSWFKNVIVTWEAFIKSLLYIPYRIETSGPILSLGWTLNNEMFFYIIMSLCILFVKKKKYLSIVCGVIITLLFILFNIENENDIINFYGKGLLPEFVFGIILYYIWIYLKNRESNYTNYILFIITILSIIFMIYSNVTHRFDYISRNIILGIPSFFTVLGFLQFEKYINKDSKIVKYFVELGDASFVMYLFHPFIMFGLTRIIYPYIFKIDSILIESMKLIILTIIISTSSIIIYKYIDKPLFKLAKRILKI